MTRDTFMYVYAHMGGVEKSLSKHPLTLKDAFSFF